MIQKETLYSNKIRIISESMSYSMIINNPLLAIYLTNIYPNEIFYHKDIWIDSILHYLNEFNELNGSTRYRRIKHLEQYLFLIERMLKFFSYSQGKYAIQIFEKLIEVGNIELLNIFQDNSKKDRFDKYQNNFIVYSLSPVKDWVLIMYLWYQFEQKNEQLKHLTKEIYVKYSEIVNEILDATEDMQLVYSMLTEKCFNKKEVIDIIAYCDLQIILNSSKVGRIVDNFWEGPFETEFFMNNSYSYQQCQKIFIDSNRFFGFRPTRKYIFSIENLWKKSSEIELCEMGEKKKAKKAHFFHFKRWDQSLMTKYTIEAIFIVASVLWTVELAMKLLSINAEIVPFLDPAIKLYNQIQSDSLSTTERAQLETELKIREGIIESKTNEFFNATNFAIKVWKLEF